MVAMTQDLLPIPIKKVEKIFEEKAIDHLCHFSGQNFSRSVSSQVCRFDHFWSIQLYFGKKGGILPGKAIWTKASPASPRDNCPGSS